ncbi:Homoserine kinase [Saezia sanguinis]|uniref:Homoserine kinase n=1 Tax=Saezia sanguinis TaxID=1965230 RepID=A0A433SGQ5_9BURK|nr:homoserine kinase [Saezia sanguinis]RUS67937.1 Homoserine kinase [Saezia sanguinis]
MAVFTEVSFDEVQAFLVPFDSGKLIALKGISSGIENTNYFVTTDQAEYVLTIFERLDFEQLPFYLGLMQHLAGKGIPVPAPQPHRQGAHQGEILHSLKNKPCALVERLYGHNQLAPQIHHCAQLGHYLALMHTAGLDFQLQQPNLRGLSWWEETIPLVLPFLSSEQSQLIQNELAFQQKTAASAQYQQLPRGPVHADLFRDNAMFDGQTPETERLSGFFDFYFAGIDTFMFDIAVCLNDWCVNLQTGELDVPRAQALMQSYHQQRPLSDAELAMLPAMLRAGALRFWTSRLWDFYLPRTAQMLTPHDPSHFERILRHRVNHPWNWLPEKHLSSSEHPIPSADTF